MVHQIFFSDLYEHCLPADKPFPTWKNRQMDDRF